VLQIPWCGLLMPSEDHETEPSACLVFCGRTVFSVPSSHVHRYCVSGVVTAAAQCLLLLSKGQGQLPRASPTAPQSPLRLPYVRYTTVSCCAGTGTTVDPAVLQVVRARQACVHYCIVRGFLLFQTAVRLMLALHNGQFPAVATAWELPRVLRYCVGRGNPFSTGPKKQFNAWWVRVLHDAEEEFKTMPIKASRAEQLRRYLPGVSPLEASVDSMFHVHLRSLCAESLRGLVLAHLDTQCAVPKDDRERLVDKSGPLLPLDRVRYNNPEHVDGLQWSRLL
jgi:hypothetical protein